MGNFYNVWKFYCVTIQKSNLSANGWMLPNKCCESQISQYVNISKYWGGGGGRGGPYIILQIHYFFKFEPNSIGYEPLNRVCLSAV